MENDASSVVLSPRSLLQLGRWLKLSKAGLSPFSSPKIITIRAKAMLSLWISKYVYYFVHPYL